MRKKDLEANVTAAKKAFNAAYNVFMAKYSYACPHTVMVVINYREPSYRKRLYVFDIKTGRLLRAHHCAHGSKTSDRSDPALARYFSNVIGSRKTSLGAMKTGKVYQGKYGKSLKLHGLEKGINHNVYRRFVVIHPAKYVSDSYILGNGRCGQSWGCPAVDYAVSSSLIDLIKDGVFVYAHY